MNLTQLVTVVGMLLAYIIVPHTNPFTQTQNVATVAQPSCAGGYLALTFDDGPAPGKTEELLALLKTNDIHATFFLIGENVEKYPELAARITADGHDVGNHTYKHEDLTKLTQAELEASIYKTQVLIRTVTGKAPEWMRPPYGNTTVAIREYLKSAGMSEVMWETDSYDWDGQSTEQIELSVYRTQPGGIILMHDTGLHTLEALPSIFVFLKANNICAGRLVNTTERMPFWDDGRAFFVKAGK